MLKYKIDSSHTKSIYSNLNCKRKLLQCKANINFNHICLRKELIPKYAYMKIPRKTKLLEEHKHKPKHYV
jgi:hypothetical protein